MDQEFQVDFDEVRRTLDRAEVITLFFPYFRKSLLLDTRRSPADTPLMRVVPMVSSGEERMRSVQQMRPRLGRPESLALIPWPRYVASVKELGVWQLIVDRMIDVGGSPTEVTLERCYRELLREERNEFRRAVTGEGYRSLWQRHAEA